ncbi:MAG: DUF2393 domain-containing protein [Acidobacteriota bacterium]|nr:DUF2393 domain-containing protein [Acidobacteriota bacterium]
MSATPSNPQPSGMFNEPAAERHFPGQASVIAVVAIAILVALAVMLGHRRPDPPSMVYAPHLVLSGIEMSESTSLSGGKSTYIDGHIANRGPAKVIGIIVQVLFKNDEAMPPQVETVPLALIRTRVPYVDTVQVSAAPLGPGGEREFRLTFENIGSNWNQQVPEIRITGVQTR